MILSVKKRREITCLERFEYGIIIPSGYYIGRFTTHLEHVVHPLQDCMELTAGRETTY
jgi:hypothetical protein